MPVGWACFGASRLGWACGACGAPAARAEAFNDQLPEPTRWVLSSEGAIVNSVLCVFGGRDSMDCRATHAMIAAQNRVES